MSSGNDQQRDPVIEAITLRMSRTLRDEIDTIWRERGFISRSEFLRYAIRSIIYDYPKDSKEIDLPAEDDALADRVLDIEHLLMEESVWCQCYTFSVVFQRFDNQQTAGRIGRDSRTFLESFSAGEPIDPDSYFSYLDTVIGLQEQLVDELAEVGGGPLQRVETTMIELREAFADRDEEAVLPVVRAQTKACALFRCVFPFPPIE